MNRNVEIATPQYMKWSYLALFILPALIGVEMMLLGGQTGAHVWGVILGLCYVPILIIATVGLVLSKTGSRLQGPLRTLAAIFNTAVGMVLVLLAIFVCIKGVKA